jgi:hypothetical protein
MCGIYFIRNERDCENFKVIFRLHILFVSDLIKLLYLSARKVIFGLTVFCNSFDCFTHEERIHG